MRPTTAGKLLAGAREASGFTQRHLACKARTSQSVIARIELGETIPSWDTLSGLLRAAGFELLAELRSIPVVGRQVLDDVPRILRLTPEQRLREVAQVSRFVAGAKRV